MPIRSHEAAAFRSVGFRSQVDLKCPFVLAPSRLGDRPKYRLSFVTACR